MSVGLKLGQWAEGDVIKGIVVGALKEGNKVGHRFVVSCSVVLRKRLAGLVRYPGSRPAPFRVPDVLARHFSDKQNVAKSAHHLVRNLLSMISSGNHIDANVLASFHINGAKLFWKSRMFSTRMERSVPLEDDTPSESDNFEKDSDSDEPLDLADEFDVTRSYRIFESLHRHHRQIESESFHALGPRGGSGGGVRRFYTFVMMISGIGLHNRIWLNLILALIGAPVGILIARRGRQPNVKGFGKVTTQEKEEEEEEDRGPYLTPCQLSHVCDQCSPQQRETYVLSFTQTQEETSIGLWRCCHRW